MTPQQPTLQLTPEYNPVAVTRELQVLHKRVNDLGVTPNVATLKANYAAADLPDAAAHAAALNSTNAALNTLLAKLNLSNPNSG